MAWGGGEQQYSVQMWDVATDQLLYTLEEQAGVVYKYSLIDAPIQTERDSWEQ